MDAIWIGHSVRTMLFSASQMSSSSKSSMALVSKYKTASSEHLITPTVTFIQRIIAAKSSEEKVVFVQSLYNLLYLWDIMFNVYSQIVWGSPQHVMVLTRCQPTFLEVYGEFWVQLVFSHCISNFINIYWNLFLLFLCNVSCHWQPHRPKAEKFPASIGVEIVPFSKCCCVF